MAYLPSNNIILLMSSYLLPYNQYTLCNALLWGNCYNHLNNVCNDHNSCWKSAFHITVALIEVIPLIGQIVSLAELFIGILYYYYHPEPTPLPPPPPLVLQIHPAPPPERFLPNPHHKRLPIEDEYVHKYIDSGGQMSDRGFLYKERNITKSFWTHICSFLDRTTLTHMRYVSGSYNSLIVCTPNLARKLTFSPFRLSETFSKNHLSQWNHSITNIASPQIIIRLQRFLNDFGVKYFIVTPELLNIICEQFQSDIIYPILSLDSPRLEGSVSVCRKSTCESLLLQLIFEVIYAGDTFESAAIDELMTSNKLRSRTGDNNENRVVSDWRTLFTLILKDSEPRLREIEVSYDEEP